MAGNEIGHKTSTEIEHPSLQPDQHESDRSGIIIQLTGTKGEWDSLDDSDFTVTLDRNNQEFLKLKPDSNDMQTDKDKEWALHSPVFHVPLSPSSPGSLGDCSPSSLGFLSPSRQPLGSLVKSLSTELELKDTSSLKPRPFISLVKSISTELSRSSPEVSQSKSDSKLSLHLWTQLTQSKGHNGDSRTAPSSPVVLSPTEAKTGFFKVELEDTCRKLTEAMHEPLSVFSKIMREDSTGRLKHQKSTSSIDSFYSKGLGRSSGELSVTETPMQSCKKVECEELAVSNQPVRSYRKCIHCRSCHSHSHLSKLEGEEPTEICTNEDAVHDINVTNKSDLAAEHVSEQPCSPVPGMGLGCVAVLSYCYFILPLSSYWSGMFVGLAFGFMLGLLLIRLGLTRHPYSDPSARFNQDTYDWIQGESKKTTLKGWINEMYAYDPETYHPSLMHSVYATLEGPCIQLDYPRSNIPRWATFNEPFYNQSFTHSRRFHLDGSKVFLLPPTLARKRVWNRKYPICITVARAEELTEEVEDQQDPHFNEKSALSPSKTNHNTTLYLFARTGREKEEWFHHLCAASMYRNEGQYESDMSVMQEEKSSSSVQVTGSIENISSMSTYDYTTYIADLISSGLGRSSQCFCHNSKQGSPTEKDQNVCHHGEGMQPVWINALIGRIFWDFLCEKYWSDQVAHKIQRKLSKIRLPYFMDELTVTELSMGSSMPQITGLFQPQVDARGLWLHLNIEYTGALQMTLETKINLSKLGKEEALKAVKEMQTYHVRSTRSKLAVLADSDEESSSAGSSDEEEVPSTEPQETQGEKGSIPGAESGLSGGSTGRRILRLVDKIAKSRYFQKATENEYIKKKIEEMSNTPLLLTVEVKELSGELAVNIPPPPTDRIWYSFCVPPKLDLRVQPKLGEREVTFCHVTEWIEKKLQEEFQKVFVLPNMDDIYLPLMNSALESQPAHQHSPTQPSHCSALGSSETCFMNHSFPLE
ncbi:testis-expressed protein 2 [Pangasianodon hypophthalmus]|uniref:testis-expressed protein 2 n=1 Tax=Pangasianodon hypophthalmus TaxID=310915 RepID=UPI0023075C08|nr:testis-expressed protein 2 [Pangasianodon hypophthalmus]XP_053094365.1 testis-expressed protein 2 [Pangasianodon hypophthalmus]